MTLALGRTFNHIGSTQTLPLSVENCNNISFNRIISDGNIVANFHDGVFSGNISEIQNIYIHEATQAKSIHKEG